MTAVAASHVKRTAIASSLALLLSLGLLFGPVQSARVDGTTAVKTTGAIDRGPR
ncbi:hypothetical protein [Streptomyces sp. NPDC049906]|uniref:hypothetical protein n=1 Tax=Streptomyces sp. NPDC049906 TaxID=3155656 RepID=UPI0034235F09